MSIYTTILTESLFLEAGKSKTKMSTNQVSGEIVSLACGMCPPNFAVLFAFLPL